jgi:hypothetical protein
VGKLRRPVASAAGRLVAGAGTDQHPGFPDRWRCQVADYSAAERVDAARMIRGAHWRSSSKPTAGRLRIKGGAPRAPNVKLWPLAARNMERASCPSNLSITLSTPNMFQPGSLLLANGCYHRCFGGGCGDVTQFGIAGDRRHHQQQTNPLRGSGSVSSPT